MTQSITPQDPTNDPMHDIVRQLFPRRTVDLSDYDKRNAARVFAKQLFAREGGKSPRRINLNTNPNMEGRS